MPIDNGGPAFPQHVAPQYRRDPEVWGMTLRDYFAGQALLFCGGLSWEERARNAYDAADAMLAERAKGGG